MHSAPLQSEFPESLEESQQLLRSQPDNVAAEVEPSVVDDDADSDLDSRPTNDQLQSFLANEATLGEMLQVLSQQYQMKSSQSEPIRTLTFEWLPYRTHTVQGSIETLL